LESISAHKQLCHPGYGILSLTSSLAMAFCHRQQREGPMTYLPFPHSLADAPPLMPWAVVGQHGIPIERSVRAAEWLTAALNPVPCGFMRVTVQHAPRDQSRIAAENAAYCDSIASKNAATARALTMRFRAADAALWQAGVSYWRAWAEFWQDVGASVVPARECAA
jgi:hypothetical protein